MPFLFPPSASVCLSDSSLSLSVCLSLSLSLSVGAVCSHQLVKVKTTQTQSFYSVGQTMPSATTTRWSPATVEPVIAALSRKISPQPLPSPIPYTPITCPLTCLLFLPSHPCLLPFRIPSHPLLSLLLPPLLCPPSSSFLLPQCISMVSESSAASWPRSYSALTSRPQATATMIRVATSCVASHEPYLADDDDDRACIPAPPRAQKRPCGAHDTHVSPSMMPRHDHVIARPGGRQPSAFQKFYCRNSRTTS